MIRTLKQITKSISLFSLLIYLTICILGLMIPAKAYALEITSISYSETRTSLMNKDNSDSIKGSKSFSLYTDSEINREIATYKVTGPDNIGEHSISGQDNVIYGKSPNAVVLNTGSIISKPGQYTVEINNGDSVTASETINIIQVNFHAGAGSFNDNQETYKGFGCYDQYFFHFAVPTPKYEGKDFLGWSTTVNDNIDGFGDLSSIDKTPSLNGSNYEIDVYAVYGERSFRELKFDTKSTGEIEGNHINYKSTYGSELNSDNTFILKVENIGNIGYEKLYLPENQTAHFQFEQIDSELSQGNHIGMGTSTGLGPKSAFELKVIPRENYGVGSYTDTVIFFHDDKFNILQITLNIEKLNISATINEEPALTKEYGQTYSIPNEKITIIPNEDNKLTPQSLGLSFDCEGFSADANAGEYNIKIKSANTNYNVTLNGEPKLTVNPATPDVNANCIGVKVGATLKDTMLSHNAMNPYTSKPVTGTIKWDLSEDTILNQEGNTDYNWTFTPEGEDAHNYNIVNNKSNVVVTKKLLTTIQHTDDPTSITYDGEEHGLTFYATRENQPKPILVEDVKYKKYGTEEVLQGKPKDAGKYEVIASIKGDKDYESATYNEEFTIQKCVPNFIVNTTNSEKRIYDGKTDLEAKFISIQVINKPDSEKNLPLEVVFEANLSNKDAGEQTAIVKITGLKLNNEISNNYAVSSTNDFIEIPTPITVHKKEISLQLTDEDKTIEKEFGKTEILSSLQFNATGLIDGENFNSLNINYSCDGAASDAVVRDDPYKITAELVDTNYKFANDEEKPIVGNIKVIKCTPVLKGDLSIGQGYKNGQLSDVNITGTFVNPYTQSIVIGTCTWLDGDHHFSEDQTEYNSAQWKFTPNSDFKNDYNEVTSQENVTINLVDKIPIGLQNISAQKYTYNGEAQAYQFDKTTNIKDDPLIEKNLINVDILYQLTRGDSPVEEWTENIPTDAGIYNVKITAYAGSYSKDHIDSEENTTLTITQAVPTTTNVCVENTSNNKVLQGTNFSDIKLTNFIGVDKSNLEGTINWISAPVQFRESGKYNYIFIPNNPNYCTASGSIDLSFSDDNRRIEADIYNLPSSEYAKVDVSSSGLLEGDKIAFYQIDNNQLISNEIEITNDNLNNEDKKIEVNLSPETLDPNGGEIKAKIINSENFKDTIITYKPELGYKLQFGDEEITEDQTIVISQNAKAKLQAKISDYFGYDTDSILEANLASNNLEYVNIEEQPTSTNEFVGSLKGINTGTTQLTYKVVFKHPDPDKQTDTNVEKIDVTKTINIHCANLEVQVNEDKPKEFGVTADNLSDNFSLLLTSEEIKDINNGETLRIDLKIVDKTPTVTDTQKIEEALSTENSDYDIDYFDISITKQIGSKKEETVSDLGELLRFDVIIDQNEKYEDNNDSYKVIRIHNGNSSIIKSNFVKNTRTLTFWSDKFSTYAIAYKLKPTIYNVSTSVTPDGAGTVTGGGQITSGNNCRLTAKHFSGYKFDHWSGVNVTNPKSSTINFVVTSDLNVVAHFTRTTDIDTDSDSGSSSGGTGGSGSSSFPSIPSGNPGSGTPSNTVTGVKISGDSNITLNTGSSKKLSVTLEPAGAQGTVKWSSSNPTVVKVDQNGNLTAVAKGIATITAECNGHKATITVKVSEATTPSKPQPSPQPQPQPQPSPNPKPQPSPAQTIEVYRLYLPSNNEHLYTTNKYEAEVLKSSGWTDEGVGWISSASGDAVYRLYSPVTNEHHYTSDVNEVNTLKNNGAWTVDNGGKPLFYSGGNQPIYRLYHEGVRRHHLTKDQNEYNVLRNNGWNDEGIALHSIS